MEIPESCTVEANFTTIKLLLHNILFNAMQYANTNSEITCGTIEDVEMVTITCQNEATPENIARMQNSALIFKPRVIPNQRTYLYPWWPM